MSDSLFSGAILAYIDPGAGSLILQALLGALLGLLFFAKRIWGYLSIRFGSVFRRSPAPDDGSTEVGAGDRP
jgi:hypothetical protein